MMNIHAIMTMLEASAEAGMLLDRRGMVTKMNRASNEMFGLPVDEGRTSQQQQLEQQHVSYFLELPIETKTNGRKNKETFDENDDDDDDEEEEEKEEESKRQGSISTNASASDSKNVYWWEHVQKMLDTSKDGRCQKYRGTAITAKEHEFPIKATTFVLNVGESSNKNEPYVYGLFVYRRIKASASPSRRLSRADSICTETGSAAIRSKEEEALMRAEYMEHAVDEALDPMFIIDHHGKILLSNRAASQKFGWTYQEFQRGNISMIAAGKHGKRHDDYLRRYLNTGEAKVIGKKRTLKAVKKDGTEFPIELGVTEVAQSEANSSDKRLFCGYVHDVTEAQRTAVELEARQEMALALINSSTEPIFQINERGKIQMCNQAATDVFQYTAEEMLGHNISMLCGGMHGPKHNEYLKHYLKTGEKRAIGMKRELQARRKDGTEIPIQLEISEVRTRTTKERFFCGFLRVLSKEKMQERELVHRGALMRGMIDSAFDPMFQINQEGIIQMANSAAVELFGWSKSELLGKNVSMIMPVEHGHNHNLYMSNYLKSGEKRVIGRNRQLNARKRDGTQFPIQLGVKEVKNPNTGESFFCGFLKDMTSVVSDQERLARKEALTVGMINSAFDPMFLINDFGIIHMVNESACDQFGYKREELLGCNISQICGGKHGEKGVHNGYLQRYLKHGGRRVIGRRRILTAKRKDGTEFPIELGVSEVKTVWKERFFCGFIRDLRRQTYDEQEMAERQKLNFAVIQASQDALFAIDEHWTVYLANSAACRLMNCGSDELRHMNLSDVFVDKEKQGQAQYKKFLRLDRFLARASPEGNAVAPTLHDRMDIQRKSNVRDNANNPAAATTATSGGEPSSSTLSPPGARTVIGGGNTIVTVELSITEVKGPFKMLLSPSTTQRPDGTRFYAVNFHPVGNTTAFGPNRVVGGALNFLSHVGRRRQDSGLIADGPKRDSHGDIVVTTKNSNEDDEDEEPAHHNGGGSSTGSGESADGGTSWESPSVGIRGGGGGCPFPHK